MSVPVHLGRCSHFSAPRFDRGLKPDVLIFFVAVAAAVFNLVSKFFKGFSNDSFSS